MKYTVNLEGFEGQRIEFQPAGFFSASKLFINDIEARQGPKRGEMVLTRNDGREVIATWRNSFLDIPKLAVENKVIDIVKPLAWYEWVWNGWPLVLLFMGGALGGLFGGLALALNLNIFRSQQSTALRYAITGAVSALALIAYLIAAIVLSLLLNK